MIQVSADIVGVDELNQKLFALVNDAMAKKQIQSALMIASSPMVKAMKARAPRAEAAYFRYYKGKRRQVQPGTLRKAIARKRVKLERSVGVAIYIRNRAFYWRFAEYGTPRMAAKPFIRNSFDNNADKALEAFKTRLRENIDKIKAKQQIAQNNAQDSE